MKVLLSAFACDPNHGSEEGNGWNWADGLAQQGFEVHCLTQGVNRENIESVPCVKNITFYYIDLPFGLNVLYSFSQPTMYLHYIWWQWRASRKAKLLNKKLAFNVAHHVTWGSVQLGSFLYRLPVPFILGPVGGGQKSPVAFKKYFGKSWTVEQKREMTSKFLMTWSPYWKSMINNASAVWVSNLDTRRLVNKTKQANIYTTLDAALPGDFFPKRFQPKVKQVGKLGLLWVGRFLPRKGALLLLDVMDGLKEYHGITLTMVGDGEQRGDFQKGIEEKGLQSNVFCKEKVSFEEVKQFYVQYDAFFFTSLRDSCPAQLIEAMAYGMPVVTLNLHGQATIVNNETGFRCPCESPEQAIEALTEAILTLYNNPDLFTRMSKAAYEFALQQTWSRKIETVVRKSYPIV